MGAANAEEKAFRWYDDEDYKPYIYKDANGTAHGIFKDLMEEIFRRLNIPLECKLYPWKRTQVFVHNGQADGMVTVPTKKRLETMLSTQPLVTSGEKIFARKDNPRIDEIMAIRDIEGMKPFKVVEVVGAGWAEENFKDLPHLIWVPKLSSALYMLANGRVDIYVMNEFSGIEAIRTMMKTSSPFQENFKKIIASPHTLKEINYTLLINKDSPWAFLVPKINAIIDDIKKDGTYDKIMEKYLQITPK
ncbi:MAG: amino acid ABC transporter substrate-binding protein [Epsilonproteobacteria bacterium]|nr:amino acid ABC transporter substrate-binding protein [Campylobacterota bacterium]